MVLINPLGIVTNAVLHQIYKPEEPQVVKDLKQKACDLVGYDGMENGTSRSVMFRLTINL